MRSLIPPCGRGAARSLVCGLMVGGAAGYALPAGAQSSAPARWPLSTWAVDVSGGVLTQPMSNGGTGPMLSVALGRRIPNSRVRLSGMVTTARVADVRAPRPDRYIVDRDWGIAAFGAEMAIGTTRRWQVMLGGKAGALWLRDRRVGVVGTPVQPGFLDDPPTTTWETGAALIPEVQAAYHLGGLLAITARAAAVQRVFTDDFIGDTGALLSIGAALRW